MTPNPSQLSFMANRLKRFGALVPRQNWSTHEVCAKSGKLHVTHYISLVLSISLQLMLVHYGVVFYSFFFEYLVLFKSLIENEI